MFAGKLYYYIHLIVHVLELNKKASGEQANEGDKSLPNTTISTTTSTTSTTTTTTTTTRALPAEKLPSTTAEFDSDGAEYDESESDTEVETSDGTIEEGTDTVTNKDAKNVYNDFERKEKQSQNKDTKSKGESMF